MRISYRDGILHRVAQLVTLAWFTWVLVWLLVGGTSRGKSWFDGISESVFGTQYKTGLPVLTMAAPLWITTAIVLLFGRSSVASSFALYVQNFDWMAIVLLNTPLIVFVGASVMRQYGSDLTKDKNIMNISNCFGIGALIAMNLLLIPVTRHSTLLKVLGWNPAAAIRLHVHSGRLVVLFSWIHGIGHMYRFIYTVQFASLLPNLAPPSICWKSTVAGKGDDIIHGCDEESAECSCYERWRNFTGIVAGLALLVIAFSSLNSLRRESFSIFYRVHILAGPTVFVASILHWNRAISYCIGGILYYLATSLLVIIEARMSTPVDVIKIDYLQTTTGSPRKPCISLTIQANETAIVKYPPGGYVHVRIPGCHTLSHPYTINLVPNQPGQVRILLRITGDGMSKLASEDSTFPDVYVEGYQTGTSKHFDEYGEVFIIAAGIGITPYLTHLHEMATASLSKLIRLYWICRDADLISFVRGEYFDTLPINGSSQIEIVIYYTGDEEDENELPTRRTVMKEKLIKDGVYFDNTRPFSPLTLAPLASTSRQAIIYMLMPFASVVVPCATGAGYIYNYFQNSQVFLSRIWIILFIVGWVVCGAIMVNFWVRFSKVRNPIIGFAPLQCSTNYDKNSDEGDDEEEECDNVEMTRSPSHVMSINDDEGDNGTTVLACMSSRQFPVTVLYGRPTSIDRLIRDFLSTSTKQAVYCCGPKSLMEDVRCALHTSCSFFGCRKLRLYEESFEL